MKNLLFVMGLLFVQVALAQGYNDQTRPENNNDLRSHRPLLIIENLSDKESVQLERNGSGDFFIVRKDGQDLARNKLARVTAEEIDQRFSAAFLKVQYELQDDPKDCNADWRLTLRGDEYKFCPKNEQKDQTIRPIFVEMRKASTP